MLLLMTLLLLSFVAVVYVDILDVFVGDSDGAAVSVVGCCC